MSETPNPFLITRRRSWAAGAALLALAAPRGPGWAQAEWPVVPLVLSTDVKQAYGKVTLQILMRIGEAARLDFRWQVVPWARAVQMAERGEALAWGLAQTPERARLLAFSEPVYENKVWMVTRGGGTAGNGGPSGAASGLPYLQGKRVCLRRGEHYDAAFEAAQRERLFEVQLTDNELPGRLRMVQTGRCDVTLISRRYSRNAMLRYVQTQADEGAGLDVRNQPLLREGIHIAGALKHPLAAHLPAINRAIREQAAAIQALIEAEG